MKIPAIVVNPAQVGYWTGGMGGYRKLSAEAISAIRRMKLEMGLPSSTIQLAIKEKFGEDIAESTIDKVSRRGSAPKAPTIKDLNSKFASRQPATDFAIVAVLKMRSAMDKLAKERIKERLQSDDLTVEEIDKWFPGVWPKGASLEFRMEALREVFDLSNKPAVTRRTIKSPTKGVDMTVNDLVAQISANPAIAEIAMNPGYAFPQAWANATLRKFRQAGATASLARAGLKQSLKKLFGSKGLRWSTNRMGIKGAMDAVYADRPRRPLPPGFKPFTKGDPRLSQFRAAAAENRPKTASMTSVQAIRSQLNKRSEFGKRLAAAETKIDKYYGHAPRPKGTRKARRAPAPVSYPVMSFVGNPGYHRRPTPRVRSYVGNPAYRGTFVENMVDTVVEGTAMAIPGILTIKGTSYVADTWATKLKWFKGADGTANFWGRAATAVVVSAVAGAGARKFAGRYSLGKVNIGETAGNGIAMAAMLYALSGIKLPGLGKPLVTVEGNVGSYTQNLMDGQVAEDAPTIVIDALVPEGQALLGAGVGMYTEREITAVVPDVPLMET